ncbi:MAG TPA: archease, partial [Candidatus Omnitrophota bacterium]|nr:archease [Candidatus Omnitrophota bacterium]
MNGKRFEMIEHPSDIGITAFGNNFKEVFENAAFGMFSLMAELGDVSTGDTFQIELKADDREELFINWLNELIFIEDSKKVLLKEFKIEKLTDKS